MADSLRASVYERRVIDDQLDVLLSGAAAVSIEGAKGVGKSATAAERVDTEYNLENPTVRSLLEGDPRRILSGERVLLDEWQHVRQTWDLVRRAVDARAAPGTFLLTGSASLDDPGRHSGAGRILRLQMRPLALSERGYQPTVSLGELLSGDRPAVTGTTAVRLGDYTREICTSGLPGIRRLPGPVRRMQLDSYVERVIDRDISELGHRVRRPTQLRNWMAAYAAATASTASWEKIRDAATPGDDAKPSRTSAIPYRDALERLFILDPVPAWAPTRSHLNQLGSSPKHHLVDPALAVTLLGLDERALLTGDDDPVRAVRDGPFLGALFESLVTLSVRAYANASESRVHHFRTHRGEREVDLIVERHDRRVLAIECKLAVDVNDDDVRHLLWLRDRLGRDLIDAVVVTTGEYAYRRADGVAVVPAALLGP